MHHAWMAPVTGGVDEGGTVVLLNRSGAIICVREQQSLGADPR